jgi:hypothetical protein
LDDTAVGTKTPSTGSFTTLRAFDGLDATVIGSRAPRAAHFSGVSIAPRSSNDSGGAAGKQRCALAFGGALEGSNAIEIPSGRANALEVVDGAGSSLMRFATQPSVLYDGTASSDVGAAVHFGADIVVERGNVRILDGDFISGVLPLTVPDYVFAPTYSLPPIEELGSYGEFEVSFFSLSFLLPAYAPLSLSTPLPPPLPPPSARTVPVREHRHLPNMTDFSEAKLAASGTVPLKKMVFALLEKVEEQALYIAQLHERSERAEGRLEAIERALQLQTGPAKVRRV